MAYDVIFWLTLAGIIVSVAASAYSAYAGYQKQSQSDQDQARASSLQAKYARQAAEQEAEEQKFAATQADKIAKIRREQTEEHTRRMLRRQGSQAGVAGVVAFEGSLLENQLEAASLGEYNAQLAEMEPKQDAERLRRGAGMTTFRGGLSASLNEFQGKLFRNRAGETEKYGMYSTIATGLSASATGATSLAKAYRE